MSSLPSGARAPEESCFCDDRTAALLDLDAVLDALGHPIRREVLCVLDSTPAVTRPQLVEQIVGLDPRLEREPAGRIAISLHHRHLPKLETANLVAVEDEGRVVRRGEHYLPLRTMVEAAVAALQ